MARPTAKRAAQVPGLIVAVLGVAFVVRELVRNWAEVVTAVDRANVWVLLAALLLGVVSLGWIAVAWRRILRVFGVERPLLDTLARYYVGQLGKYVPGGIWPVVGQAEMARRAGVDGAAAYGTTLLSLGLTYLAAALVAGGALLLGGAPTGEVDWWPVLLLLPTGVLALHPRVVDVGLRLLARLTGTELDLPVPRWPTSIGLLLLHVPVWLGISTATWLVANDLDPVSAPVMNLVLATTLSWLVGFLAVGVPGGIGVREAVFIATATGLTSDGAAAAVAVTARLVFVVADATGAALTSGLAGRSKVRDALRSR